MGTVEYLDFNKIDKNELLPLLNSKTVREHLIDHELFTVDTLTTWMQSKMEVDATPGCRVRGIVINGELAGWCGIQPEDDKYELAIIIDEKFWGLGIKVFKEIMCWAKELNHKVVYIHFLHTRPKYKFLMNMASNVYQTELFNNTFTTYQISVK